MLVELGLGCQSYSVERAFPSPCSQRVVVLLTVPARPESQCWPVATTSAYYQRCPIDWDPGAAGLVETASLERPAAVVEPPRASEAVAARPRRGAAEPEPSRAEQVVRPAEQRQRGPPASQREQVRRLASASPSQSGPGPGANSNRAVPTRAGREARGWGPPRPDHRPHGR